ncbi:caspase family protein [Pseudonocardia sp. TRM90224]|uniref:caspase family protein n=1 Tax=Pseudonocardia sp. TRM90224 TaxID=2812678 RepID=UPI001E549563|nr:caspase family protein [Pseudonocardia sp. TRM90224]
MGRRAALLVGTFDYRDEGLARLAAPGRDVEALAAVLGDAEIAGFDVVTLLNQPHHIVGEAVGDFYDGLRRDDLALLYISGHGVKDDRGRLFFAMTNTRRDQLLFTALGAEQVNDAMTGCLSRQKVLILDCCYGGAFPSGWVPKGDTDLHTLDRFGGRGRVVLTASDATQYSFEGDHVTGGGPASVFTRHLVEGLRTGLADLDGDGDVAVDELYSYVHDRVTADLPQQRPKKQDDVEGRIVIARNVNWALPPFLRNSLQSPLPADRLTAVDSLIRMYRTGNGLVRERIWRELEGLVDDDIRSVTTAVRTAMRSLRPESGEGVDPDPDAAEQVAAEAAERARRAAADEARLEVEESARKEAAERARQKAADSARRSAAEQARREAAEAKRHQAAEQASQETPEPSLPASEPAEPAPARDRSRLPTAGGVIVSAALGIWLLTHVFGTIEDGGPAVFLTAPVLAGAAAVASTIVHVALRRLSSAALGVQAGAASYLAGHVQAGASPLVERGVDFVVVVAVVLTVIALGLESFVVRGWRAPTGWSATALAPGAVLSQQAGPEPTPPDLLAWIAAAAAVYAALRIVVAGLRRAANPERLWPLAPFALAVVGFAWANWTVSTDASWIDYSSGWTLPFSALAVLYAAAVVYSPGERLGAVFLLACALAYLVALAQVAPFWSPSSWDLANRLGEPDHVAAGSCLLLVATLVVIGWRRRTGHRPPDGDVVAR